MHIHGLQKLTLLDIPEKVGCTVFTIGCNFRCPFCHNAALVMDIHPEDEIPEGDVLAFLKQREGLLDGVAVTGGEPLMQTGLADFLRSVKDLGYSVKLDTNGSCPEKLKSMIGKGLIDYVTMDLKNTKGKYARTIGLSAQDVAPYLERIEQTMALLRDSGIRYEYRTTVVQEFHTKDDVVEMARWLSRFEVQEWYLQMFHDSGNLIGRGLHAVSPDTMAGMMEAAAGILPRVRVRGVDISKWKGEKEDECAGQD